MFKKSFGLSIRKLHGSSASFERRIPSFANIKPFNLIAAKKRFKEIQTENNGNEVKIDQKVDQKINQIVSEKIDEKIEKNKKTESSEKLNPNDEQIERFSLVKTFLFGNDEGKKDIENLETSFSESLMRGKYVHEIVFHKVLPENTPKYVNLVEQVYPKLIQDSNKDPNSDDNARLIGSWRTVVGDMDTFIHIWEYKGYQGFHKSQYNLHKKIEFLNYLEALRPLLRSRYSNLMQEFAFWGNTSTPHMYGGVFELRSYKLKSGMLMEWESAWRKGIDVRRKVMEPIGAWFTQLGELNKVYHLWQFADLEVRKISREKCWQIPGWAETTHDTVKLIDTMDSNILVPLSFSPLK